MKLLWRNIVLNTLSISSNGYIIRHIAESQLTRHTHSSCQPSSASGAGGFASSFWERSNCFLHSKAR